MTSTDAVDTARIVHILAISGSLRQGSSNTALLKAAIALSPEFIEINLYGGLGNLPHFNHDLESVEPLAVTDLPAQVKWADGIIISGPEYAHERLAPDAREE